MNVEVLILFLNATLVTVLSSVIVIGILRKQYRPVIRQMEEEEEQNQGFYELKKKENVN